MNTKRSLLLLSLSILAMAAPGFLRGAESSEFAIEARALPHHEASPTSGEFTLDGNVVSRIDTQKNDLTLEPSCVGGALKLGTAECGCLCGGAIFEDGFESGDTTAWSSSVP